MQLDQVTLQVLLLHELLDAGRALKHTKSQGSALAISLGHLLRRSWAFSRSGPEEPLKAYSQLSGQAAFAHISVTAPEASVEDMQVEHLLKRQNADRDSRELPLARGGGRQLLCQPHVWQKQNRDGNLRKQ